MSEHEITDQELIVRMRSALDEVAADDEQGVDAAVVPVHAPAPSHTRWWAVAAAAVLVVGGVAAIAVNRGHDAPVADGSTPATELTDPTTTAPAVGPSTGYVLSLPGFVAQPVETEQCCPPTVSPGPKTVVAWGATSGLTDGLLLLTTGPIADGPPAMFWNWNAMPGERVAALQAKVVEGSGVPYVLDDPSMQLLGFGFEGMGNLTRQTFEAADGSVTVSVGDYRGQLHLFGDDRPITVVTIAGTEAYRVDTDAGTVVVWQVPRGQWAMLEIDTALASRTDEIIAGLAEATTEEPTSTTVPGTTGSAGSVYVGSAAGIIDSGSGPMLAFGFLTSFPPQGGDLPLAGFDWTMVDDDKTANGVTWTESGLSVVGTFDGTTFTLTEPPGPYIPVDDRTFGTATAGCTDATYGPLLNQLGALDFTSLHMLSYGEDAWDGRCGVFVEAMFDSPELRAALSPLGDDVTTTFMLHVVQP